MNIKNDNLLNIAVLIPCYNEAFSVEKVIKDFQKVLPGAVIFVFDNASTDETAAIAEREGAVVYSVPLKGKGNVIRRMFADIDADIYVMVDGDATYDAQSAPRLINHLLAEHLDMLVGARHHLDKEAYRLGHTLGNKLLTGCVSKIFGGDFTDMLSGFRVFSRRYVKSFPALSSGFETETELTVHALELRMPYGEMPTPYCARLEGSTSKLNTYRDGLRILKTIVRLYAVERPLIFYFLLAMIVGGLGVLLSLPIISEYVTTGLVPRLPTALLSTGMVLSSIIFFIAGMILETVTMGRREMKRLAYLAIPALTNHYLNPRQKENMSKFTNEE
ncbi:glycosyltransferase family 2 protein [Acerihabitans sp. TG2]|uniref:glycosyltransferase family 2 protein n=1 Tax=Acerihabitans sp. TG2 TaxID=3096008 RepID=UPI002B23D74D|nr:glycosyltransferase family 2 protein [Acerihabitans sp. TG2]MEA9393433.1 glycosyltransferase family 2 protein [Acerihabitans sp. TG2]